MPRAGRWLLPFLLALCLIRLWLMPLASSFWLDETATIFVAQHGANHPSLADAAPQAWRSWYYPLIHFDGRLFGYSEVAARFPSILAMLAVLALMAWLARRLIHPEAAWFAAFACLALPGLNYQAANARPYAVGMCLFAAAMVFLVRWLDDGRWGNGLLFAATSAGALYVHLLFWPSCAAFLLYAVARVAERTTSVRWGKLALVFALLACALLPVLLETLALLRDARAHVIAPLPSPREFLSSLELPLFAACGGGAWLVARLRRWRPKAIPLSSSAVALVAAWWLCQPTLLFAFSWVTGDAVFVPRYRQLALPGVALAATAVAARFIPVGRWRALSAALAVGLLLWLGQWRQAWPRHHNSDWRAAAAAVNRIERSGSVPVICPSPFIEARPAGWRPGYPLPGFLYTHLDVYPIAGKVYLFPFEGSAAAESYALYLTGGPLAGSGRFVIYGWEPQVHFWRDWFARRPEFRNWHKRRLGPFADEDVVVFDRIRP